MTTESPTEYENSSLFASNCLYAYLEKGDVGFKFVYGRGKVKSAEELIEEIKKGDKNGY